MRPDEQGDRLDRDPLAIDRLRKVGGGTLVARMATLVLEHGPKRVADIAGGAEAGDLERAGGAAHSLRSSAGNMGFRSLQRLAEQAERAAVAGDAEVLRTLSRRITDHWERVAESLRGMLEDME